MEISIERQETIQHQFDAYSKKVVKYEMINCYREQERRGKRQVLFSDLPEAVFNQFAFAIYDEYFAEEYIFCVVGFNIPVKNELLAEALITLSEERQNIILMYYYLGMSDREISDIFSSKRSSIHYNRSWALRLMREYMEVRYGE
jgi:DNA-directed RNA polymerase specialized sigma24 family protein